MIGKLFQTGREVYLNVTVSLIVFVFSLSLSQIYTDGDQVGYHNAYRLVEGLGLRDGFSIYEKNISSADFVYFLLISLGSNLGIEKNTFMALINGILVFFALKLLEKWKVDFRVSCLIILTNFYVFVLYFAAERLKFGFLFLVISGLYFNKSWKFYSFAFLSIMAHFSMFFVFIALWMADCFNKLSTIRKEKQLKELLLLFLVLLPPLLLFWYESKMLLWKLGTYITANGYPTVMSFIPLGGLIILTGIYTKNMRIAFFMFAPFVVGVVFLGGSRLNMLAYFVFLCFGLRVNAGLNAGILITSVYFFYKSIGFVANILVHGHGFR